MNVQKIILSDISKKLPSTFDLFICSSSFEERSLSVANHIDITSVKKALIVANINLQEYVGANTNNLANKFKGKAKIVETSTEDPIITADNISKNIADAIDAKTILLDITAFTHESLLILLRLLQLHCPSAKITGVYASASAYSADDDVKHKWLSRGIGEVRSVLGFPGNIVPSRNTHLIRIVGYEHERAAGIIDSIEPNSIALGYGRSGSATTEKDKDANEHYMHLVEQMATSFSAVNCFELPCNDPYKVRDIIQDQVNKAGDLNILIAPMNNKLSTIGAAWVALNNESIQMCYANALRYNYSNYSRPGTDCYVFDLKLPQKVQEL